MDDFLLNVRKPARYIGQEWNVPAKDFSVAPIRCALCFPDLYEIGMSNLGVRIIYGILNTMPDVACERVFSYAADMEQVLRERQRAPFSLETRTALRSFDIIGFSVGSELCYTNILNMLSMADIPLSTAERTGDDPFVIAGGPCVLNPEPLHAFIDAFMIGEWEEAIEEVIALYRRHQEQLKKKVMAREEFLRLLASVEGVYVPSLYEVAYQPDGSVAEFSPRCSGIPASIKKRYVRDLDTAFFPTDWLVPYIQVIHDRISLEIMRGCPNHCRFCQAKVNYHPLRIRDPQKVFSLARESYDKTGYEEIALCGLSVSDYPHIEGLVKELITYFKRQAVGISFPSIKAHAILAGSLFELIASIKKTGLTFAPEAGSRRLRNILSKNFDEETFFAALTRAFEAGYKHVKLYFMIGLPYEEHADIEGIVELTKAVSAHRQRVTKGKGRAQVNVSINAFIPKPHTTFQWFGMQEEEALREKEVFLRESLRDKRFVLSFHDRAQGFLEAVLARGDRRVSAVIARAYGKGARFDAWDEHFLLSRWLEAFQEEGIDPFFYLKPRDIDTLLPWDFIDTGVPKQTLKDDFNKTIAMLGDR